MIINKYTVYVPVYIGTPLIPHLEFSSFGRVQRIIFEYHIFVNWQCSREIFVAGQENSSFGRQEIFSSKGRNIFVKKQPHQEIHQVTLVIWEKP